MSARSGGSSSVGGAVSRCLAGVCPTHALEGSMC